MTKTDDVGAVLADVSNLILDGHVFLSIEAMQSSLRAFSDAYAGKSLPTDAHYTCVLGDSLAIAQLPSLTKTT